jgi:23S rRNA pseudouridine1911/1915/1917 synthase
MTPSAPDEDRDATLVVAAADAGRRLDEYLAERLEVGRRTAMRLASRARINGRIARKGDRVQSGDAVVVPSPDPAAGAADDAPLALVRELPSVLVLDKPAALPSVALRGAAGDSLAARIARHFPECARVGAPGEAGLVHRLDTGTSGLLLAARTDEAYRALRAQFRAHAVVKEYLAVIAGRLERAVTIDAPIGQHRGSVRRVRAIMSPDAARRYAPRPARTDAAPEQLLPDATLVRARTTTGARHQIRVHLASIGHPLLGDPLYGSDTTSPAGDGFLLHASRLEWTDPASGAPTCDVAPLPAAWQQHLAHLAAAPTDPRARRDRR